MRNTKYISITINDPLSEITRKTRKMLLIFSFAGIAIFEDLPLGRFFVLNIYWLKFHLV